MEAAEVVSKIEDTKAVTMIGPDLTEAISKRIEAIEDMVAVEEAEATEVAVETVAEVIVAEVREEVSPKSLCPHVCYQVNQFHWS